MGLPEGFERRWARLSGSKPMRLVYHKPSGRAWFVFRRENQDLFDMIVADGWILNHRPEVRMETRLYNLLYGLA